MKRISILLASAAMLLLAASVQAQEYNMCVTRADGSVIQNTRSFMEFLDDDLVVIPRYEQDTLTNEYRSYSDTIAVRDLQMVDFLTVTNRKWENDFALSASSYSDSHADFGYGAVMHLRDMMTEDMTTLSTGYNWFSQALQLNLAENYSMTVIPWGYHVRSILTCTDFIRSVDPAMAPDVVKGALAEALVVRALLNLDFARMYEFLPNERTSGLTAKGNSVKNLTVPLLNEDLKVYGTAYFAPRVTKKEISDYILSDLQRAESLIDYITSASHEFPHQDVINGLRARLALWNEDYAAAQYYATLAIDQTSAHLMTPDEILSTTCGFNDLTPWMWGVQQDLDTERNIRGSIVNFTSWMSSEWTDGYASLVPPMIGRSLYDRISDTDVRKLLFIAPVGTALSGQSPTIQGNADLRPYTAIKFRPANGQTEEIDAVNVAYPLMRLEEMYFIAMESMARQGQLDQAKVQLVKLMALRDPSYSSNATNSATLLEEILLQKRIELWGEGQTFFDVKRTNQSVVRDYDGTNFYQNAVQNSIGRPWWMNITIPSIAMNNNLALYGFGNPQEEPTVLDCNRDVEFILDEPAYKKELSAVHLDSITYFRLHGTLPARLAGGDESPYIEFSNNPDFSVNHLAGAGTLSPMDDGSGYFQGEILSSTVITSMKAFQASDNKETTGRATVYVRALCGDAISNTVELPVILPEEDYSGLAGYSYAPRITVSALGTIDCEAVAGEDYVPMIHIEDPDDAVFYSSQYSDGVFASIGTLYSNSGRISYLVDKQGQIDNRQGEFNYDEEFLRQYVAEEGASTLNLNDVYLYGYVVRGDLIMRYSTYEDPVAISLNFNAQVAAESKYSWSNVGNLVFNSGFDGTLSGTRVTLQRASEDSQLYRIIAPYQRNHNLMFRVDEQGKVTMLPQAARYTDGLRTSVSGTGQMVEDQYFRLNLIFTAPDGQQMSCAEILGTHEEWFSLGKGTYRDDFVASIYGVENVTYEVEVQMSNSGKIRMVNPYGAAYPYNEEGDYDPNANYYLTFDISNPDAVLMDPSRQELGLDWGYGMFSIYHLGSAYAGTFSDGVLTFPQNAFYIAMADYNGGNGSWYANENGQFALALPGSRIKDYSYSISNGVVTERDNGATIFFQIELSEDVSYARYAFATEATLESVENALRNGEGTLVQGRSQQVSIEVTESDTYYCVLLCDQGTNPDALAYGRAFYENLTWHWVGTGTYTYSVWDKDEAEPDPGYSFYQCDSRSDTYKIAEWCYGVDFKFTMSEDGTVSVPEQPIGYNHSSYGPVMVAGLSAYGYPDMDHSSYDAATRTFTFSLIYYVDAGNFGYGEETFVLDSVTRTLHRVRTKAKQQLTTLQPKPLRLLRPAAILPEKEVRRQMQVRMEAPGYQLVTTEEMQQQTQTRDCGLLHRKGCAGRE